MPAHKTSLVALLLLLGGLVVLHRVLRAPADIAGSVAFEWHFWLPAAVAVGLVVYAFSIRCSVPSCGRRQVFRGVSVFDLRWPGERCYYCRALLKPSASERQAP